MAVLGIKDSKKLEVIRKYRGRDKNFFSILNRAVDDLEQRDVDLDLIHTPSRGFRVRATSPASDQVEIEGGVFINGSTIVQRTTVTLASVTAASAGQKRIDLVYLRLDTNAIVRLASAEAATYGAVTKPNLPSGITAIPLAYLYVGDSGPVFEDNLAVDTDGAIEDIRLGPGSSPGRLFESNVNNILVDSASGSVGTLDTVARADHSHPLNVDATVPTSLTPGNAGAAGSSNKYARVDHVHQIATETNPAVLQGDVALGSVGVANTLARADHRHPLNVDGTLPLTDSGTGSAGTAGTYARVDHRHPLNVPTSGLPAALLLGAGALGSSVLYARADHSHPFAGMQVSSFVMSWTNDNSVKSTGGLPFTPKIAIALLMGFDPTTPNNPQISIGYAIGVSSGVTPNTCSIAVAEAGGGATTNLFTASASQDSIAGLSDPVGGTSTNAHTYAEFAVTAFAKAGISIQPSALVSVVLHLLVIGDDDS